MKYLHIGWCKEDKHDKVWGIIQIGFDKDTAEWSDPNYYKYQNKYVTFWGRRGAKLQTKLWESSSNYEAENMFQKKQDKGYKRIRKSELDTVYPEFQTDLEKTAIWATLKL